MISDETLTVTLEEAVENQLLRSGSPAAAAAAAVGNEDGVNLYWETVERHVAAEDYTPLLGLVAELRDKIIGLTPRRRDLAAETCEAMDVELLEQMVEYGAFDVVSFFILFFLLYVVGIYNIIGWNGSLGLVQWLLDVYSWLVG